jgi:hypothetical protein
MVETENTIYLVNKAGANTVYVVLAVAFILTASAKASSAQPVYVLRACIAAQLSLNIDDNSGNFLCKSHASTLPTLPNIGPETFGTDANTELRSGLDQISDNSQSFSPASDAISFVNDALRTPFVSPFSAPSGQDAKYRFAYLKRDLAYVRSKS